ncbi:unnamed protein product [Effrenium voratum]|nr:unnamed protein product [Effrenium voratum]
MTLPGPRCLEGQRAAQRKFLVWSVDGSCVIALILLDGVEVLVKSGVPRADVDLPAGLRLGTENVMDPLIVPDVEPSAEQVLQADRELARIFVAMFKQALKKRLRIVFRTNKQAATAKRLWGKAAGEVRVLSMPGSSAQKGAFAEGEEPGAAFLQSMKASGDGFVVLVAPRRRQLEAIARAAEEVNSKTCFILLNARLRSAKKDALREELASAFAPAFHLRLVQQGEGLVYRAMQEGSSPWILARRKLPSTVATEVAQTMEEPSAERIAQVFA